MFDSPSSDADEPNRLSRRVVSPKLEKLSLEVRKRAVQGYEPGSALQSHFLNASYVGQHQKCNFFLVSSIEKKLTSRSRSDGLARVGPAARRAAFRRTGRACRSRSRTAGRPGERTSRCRGSPARPALWPASAAGSRPDHKPYQKHNGR